MKHKAFTLVELLIVIVVIGVLSTMMMLASTEIMASAKASNIISNMNIIRKAALEYCADNQDFMSSLSSVTDSKAKKEIFKQITMEDVLEYVDSKKNIKFANSPGGKKDFEVYDLDWDGHDAWCVQMWFGDGSKIAALDVRRKLEGRAKSSGLFSASKDNKRGFYTANSNRVQMKILSY